MLPPELQRLIQSLPVDSQTVVQAVIVLYESKIAHLEAHIKTLEDQLSQNSKNSSKPPSSDGYQKPSPKSLRSRTRRKRGGQKGHRGSNLKMSSSPDNIIIHQAQHCRHCHQDLHNATLVDISVRQVYDIPPLRMEVSEHRVLTKRCSCGCLNQGTFPPDVTHYVQYGANIKTLLTYLQDYQLLPYGRCAELVDDLFEHQISPGTLYNIRKHTFEQLADFEHNLELFLCAATLAGFDETGLRVVAKLHWLHSCSTQHCVHYQVHEKRGSQAMDDIGILPQFQGIAVHDFWKSYYQYACKHGLCNAHILRELIFIKERFEQDWAQQLIDLLLNMKQARQRAIDQNKSQLSQQTLRKYRKRYENIVQIGIQQNPLSNAPPQKAKRGRKPKSKPRNLLERLDKYADDILRFFYDFTVPFDNNFSERDLRMMKVKLKISGCFRSLNGAKYFARIRSYIGTARKQGINAFEAIRSLFTDHAVPDKLISNLYC